MITFPVPTTINLSIRSSDNSLFSSTENENFKNIVKSAVAELNTPVGTTVSFNFTESRVGDIVVRRTNLGTISCGGATNLGLNGVINPFIEIDYEEFMSKGDNYIKVLIMHETLHCLGITHTNILETGDVAIPGTENASDGSSIMAGCSPYTQCSCMLLPGGTLSPCDREIFSILWPDPNYIPPPPGGLSGPDNQNCDSPTPWGW